MKLSNIYLLHNLSIRSPHQIKTANKKHMAEWTIFKHQEVRSIDSNKNPYRVQQFGTYVKLHKAVFWNCMKTGEMCNYTYSSN